jgi:DNA-binding GntR family transcriptional regulator
VHGVLQARLRRIRYVGNESPAKWAAAVADHETMITALEARDGERLAKVLGDHMRNTWDRVRDSL